nr:DUF3313 domain-containing protein [Rhizobium sp. FKL33]
MDDTYASSEIRVSTPGRAYGRAPFAPLLVLSLLAAAVSGCSSVALTDGHTLTSSTGLGPQTGRLSKSRIFVDPAAVGAAKTARIELARLSPDAEARVKDPKDRALVANAVSRALCVGLSDKYRIVGADEPADLTVRTTVTRLTPTGKVAAGVSTAVTLGSSFILPVSAPRLPIGLGGIAVEAEALDAVGAQRAAMVWSRGANAITNSPRVSEIGDAYELSGAFGQEFSRLVIDGKAPGMMPKIPSGQKLKSTFGGKPKYAACEAFGRAPGVPGMVAGMVGAPPGWTDKSAAKAPSAPGQ